MRRPAAARGLVAFAAARLVSAALAMLAAVAIACLVFEVVPSRPVRLLTQNLTLSQAQRASVRHQFGIGRPIDVRFWHLLENAVRLRLGFSYQFQEPIASLIGRHIGPTLLLMASSAAVAAIVGAGLRRWGARRLRGLSAGAAMALWSAPAFWIGLVLLVALGVGAGGFPAVFPAGGLVSPGLSESTLRLAIDALWHLVLPCVTLALVLLGQSAAAGRRTPALARIGTFVSATVAVEVVFSWPGLGDLAYQALQTPDILVLEGVFLALGAVTIAADLVIAVAGRAIGPRRQARPESATAVQDAVAASTGVSRADRVRAFLRTPGGFAGVTIIVLVVAWTLAAPLFVHPAELDLVRDNAVILHSPTLAEPLGTDETGRPELALVLWGGRSSLTVAAVAAAAALVVGVAVGGVARRWPRSAGRPAAALTAWFSGLGALPLAISLAAIIGPGETSLAAAVAITSWAAVARLIGVRRTCEPIGLVGVCAAFALADALLGATTLSFLGLGDPFRVSWGAILNQAFVYGDVTSGAWWTLVPPGAAILVTVLALRLGARAAEGMLSRPATPRPAPTSSG